MATIKEIFLTIWSFFVIIGLVVIANKVGQWLHNRGVI